MLTPTVPTLEQRLRDEAQLGSLREAEDILPSPITTPESEPEPKEQLSRWSDSDDARPKRHTLTAGFKTLASKLKKKLRFKHKSCKQGGVTCPKTSVASAKCDNTTPDHAYRSKPPLDLPPSSPEIIYGQLFHRCMELQTRIDTLTCRKLRRDKLAAAVTDRVPPLGPQIDALTAERVNLYQEFLAFERQHIYDSDEDSEDPRAVPTLSEMEAYMHLPPGWIPQDEAIRTTMEETLTRFRAAGRIENVMPLQDLQGTNAPPGPMASSTSSSALSSSSFANDPIVGLPSHAGRTLLPANESVGDYTGTFQGGVLSPHPELEESCTKLSEGSLIPSETPSIIRDDDSAMHGALSPSDHGRDEVYLIDSHEVSRKRANNGPGTIDPSFVTPSAPRKPWKGKRARKMGAKMLTACRKALPRTYVGWGMVYGGALLGGM